MFQIKVKWGKETYDVTVDPAMGVALFKAQLQSLTSVPADRMKIMGVKGGQLRDDADLNDVGLADGKVLMLIGTAAATTPAAASAGESPAQEAGSPAAATATPTPPVPEGSPAPAATPLRKALPTVGLVNLANTCYMNSCVQVLRTIPEAVKAYGSSPHPLGRALYQTIAALERSDGSRPLPPAAVWTELMRAEPRFGELDDHNHPMQHDAQEALGVLLGAAGEGRTFSQGELTTTEVGVGAAAAATSAAAVVREPFTTLTCAISSEVSAVETGISLALESKVVGGGEGGSATAAAAAAASGAPNSAAPSPAATTTTTRVSKISQLPDVLTVHLSRFAWRADTKQKAKVLRPVTFPTVLDVSRWCTPELQAQLNPEREKVKARRDLLVELRRAMRLKPEEGIATILKQAEPDKLAQLVSAEPGPLSGFYELFAVVSHKGRSADHGHYVAWIKHEDLWYVCDDENIGLVAEADVKRLSGVGEGHIAYLLFYRARDPRTKLSPMVL